MLLSGAEIFLSLMIIAIGIIRNIKLYFNNVEKKKQINWCFNVYGTAIIVIICGLFTPADILSNIIFSIPLTIIYVILLNKIRLKYFYLNQDNK